MIIGTAGHIDHGKTSLIRLLTGRETDRLPEEKRRGISIELGYAYLPVTGLPDPIGFIDVPGHERFVHTMLAGATGIDHALLIIAADDGPMQQTYEHADILRLLGVQSGSIVLTKTDLVEPGRLQAALSEIAVMVADSPLFDWPIYPVSSATGEGLDALQSHLQALALGTVLADRPAGFRLAIDRCFVLQGRGTIVTGTAHSGSIREGQEVWLAELGQSVRVRSIHAQDRQATVGVAGQRLALNLAGIGHDAIQRGDWLTSDPPLLVTRFDVELDISSLHERALSSGLEVHLHHGTRDLLAKVFPLDTPLARPGERILAGIQASAALPVCKGDRIIIRDSQAQTTLAGGRVLDPAPPTRGRRQESRLAVLRKLSGNDLQAQLAAYLEAAPRQIRTLEVQWSLSPSQLRQTVDQVQAIEVAGMLLSGSLWSTLQRRALSLVQETHAREPEMPGIELQRLRRQLQSNLTSEVHLALIDTLVAEGQLVRRGAFLADPGHRSELEPRDKALWASIEPLLSRSPFQPPRVRDIANELHVAEAEVRLNLRKVARLGEAVLVAHDHFFLRTAVRDLAQIAQDIQSLEQHLVAAAFRDRIGGGRKVAIQILEFFDRIGFTRRIKDNHLIRADNPWLHDD